MAEINLLKNDLNKRSFLSGKTGLWSLYIVIGVLILEALVFLGLSIYQRSIEKKVISLKQESQAVEFEQSKVEGQRLEAISFQERLLNLRTLLDSKLYWSPLFENLEDNTLNTVFYRTFQVSEFEQMITISGIAPTYTDMAKLIRGLELAPSVENVTLVSSGTTESEIPGLVFGLEIEFDKNLLSRPEDE